MQIMQDYKYLPSSFYVPHAENAQKSVKEHAEKIENLSILISKKINEASYEGLSCVTVTEIFDLGQEVVTEVFAILRAKNTEFMSIGLNVMKVLSLRICKM